MTLTEIIEMHEAVHSTAEKKMKVKEVIKMHSGDYDRIEIYCGDKLRTDYCRSYVPLVGRGACCKGEERELNSCCLDYEVKDYLLMNIEDCDDSILANCCATDEDFFESDDEKILCILI